MSKLLFASHRNFVPINRGRGVLLRSNRIKRRHRTIDQIPHYAPFPRVKGYGIPNANTMVGIKATHFQKTPTEGGAILNLHTGLLSKMKSLNFSKKSKSNESPIEIKF